MLFLAAILTGPVACGSDGTKTLESPTTTDAGTASTAPESQSIESLIKTFKKLGFNETQTRCMVEKLEDLSSEIGPTDTISADDQSKVEELMKACGLS